ncbi:MAG TPA: sigma-54 dependent transcriptional regulator [Bacteroidota bacterium]|nr:sigma-54 dependent transcriptional regulator [Bacteroidota bacterium]
MDERAPHILVVDDERNVLNTIGICFDAIGYRTTLTTKPQEVLSLLQSNHFDLAFVDLKMAPLDGMEILAEIRLHAPNTTVIMMTAHGSVESAVEAIKQGAYHYLQKPFDFDELKLFAQKVWEYHRLKEEVQELRTQLRNRGEDGSIITKNREMIEQIELAARAAESQISILIEGESGTGKELIAQYIHKKSPRAQQPFVRVNCAAIPEQLLESELFGHARGAFTGAVKEREGRFESAEGGTIFLDEIAELSPAIQAKLLRMLQSHEFERLGENVTRKVDVRVIAATNKNIDEALKEGSFREDLFYRLNGIRLRLPPLRERPEDIGPLLHHTLLKLSGGANVEIAPDAEKALRAYRWSGNVRELENVIERALLLSSHATITLDHLPREIRSTGERPAHALSLEEMERSHIKRVLQHAKDFDEASRILGIDRVTLWNKRKKYGLT